MYKSSNPEDWDRKDVCPERSAWRDEGISRAHRSWGLSLYATDIDLTLVEYESLQPRGIIEYKREHTINADPFSPNNQVPVNLGNRAGLPVFLTIYSKDYTPYTAKGLNPRAVRMPGSSEWRRFDLKGWIAFLRWIRDLPNTEH